MAETKSGSYSLQWHGPQYSNSGTTFIATNKNHPRMYTTISYTLTRDSKTSPTVHVTLYGELWRLFESGLGWNKADSSTGNYGNNANSSWTAYFGYYIDLFAQIGGVEKEIAYKGNSPSQWTSAISKGTHTFDINWPSNDKMALVFKARAGCTNCTVDNNRDYTIANVAVPEYDPTPPWSDPTNLKGVTNSATTRKPDWDLKVSWTAAKAGTGNSISKYRVQMRRYRGSWSSWTDVNTNVTGTSLTFNPGSIMNLRPGDLIATRVAAYMTSNTSGHSSGWLGYVEAGNNNVSIYKDGIVYYVSSAGGAKTECPMAYYYDSSGKKKTARYIIVKDSGGTTHIIDMYTTNYE